MSHKSGHNMTNMINLPGTDYYIGHDGTIVKMLHPIVRGHKRTIRLRHPKYGQVRRDVDELVRKLFKD